MEAFVQFPERRGGRGPAQVGEGEEALPRDRRIVLNDPEDRLHIFREAGRLRGLVQPEVLLRAVRPVLRDREAFRQETPAVQPLQRPELFDPEAGREIGTEASEGFRGGDRIGETRLEGDALFREGERDEVLRIEVLRDNRTVGEEVGETQESRTRPVREVLRLRHGLPLESGDAEDIDPTHCVELHHSNQGGDRLVQEVRRR